MNIAPLTIAFKRSAATELRRVPKLFLQAIIETIWQLRDRPLPDSAEILHLGYRTYRIRQDDFRIVYAVDDKEVTILAVKFGHRKFADARS